jgi:hypothetical protein
MLTTFGVDSFRENETFDRNFRGIPMFCTGKIFLKETREMVLGSIVDPDPVGRAAFHQIPNGLPNRIHAFLHKNYRR